MDEMQSKALFHWIIACSFLPLNDRQLPNKLQEEPIFPPHVQIAAVKWQLYTFLDSVGFRCIFNISVIVMKHTVQLHRSNYSIAIINMK